MNRKINVVIDGIIHGSCVEGYRLFCSPLSQSITIAAAGFGAAQRGQPLRHSGNSAMARCIAPAEGLSGLGFENASENSRPINQPGMQCWTILRVGNSAVPGRWFSFFVTW